MIREIKEKPSNSSRQAQVLGGLIKGGEKIAEKEALGGAGKIAEEELAQGGEKLLPARGETTRTDPSFDRTKEWVDPTVKEGENLAGMDHLSDEHAPWSETSPDKSKFTQDTWNNLKQTVQDAVKNGKSKDFKPMENGPQAGSVYDYKPGYQTGVDGRGKPLNGIRVVVDANNQVVTAFPIK
jgi:hypothetical protein